MNRRTIASKIGLVIGMVALVAGAVTAREIPVDTKGLPLWQVKEWIDFPVVVELDDHAALATLLETVPLASFNREQVRIVRDGLKSTRLVLETRVTEAEEGALLAAGYESVRVPDLDRRGREAAEATWAAQYEKGGAVFETGEKGVWHTHAQVGAILAQTATDHPALARTFTWGGSVEGRDLYGLVISADVHNTRAEPEVRLSGTMHGDEPPCMEMLLFLVDYLTDNYGQPGYEDVTDLVDNYEIHFMPLHNPDGMVADRRYNANSVDLNRNFDLPAGTHSTVEIENDSYRIYANAHHFVISQNGHSGALVVNYPWDYTYTLAPDDAALQKLSLEFSTYNLPMYNGGFTQGITNGAAWYITTGCVQDWSYDQTDCIDLTIEYHNTKWPDASTIDPMWEDNRESLMHFIKAARYGVNGIVTSTESGLPLDATITVAGNAMPVHTDPEHGDYYKLLDTGTYDITFAADGYISQTVYGVSTTWGTPAVLDVALQPMASGDIAGTVTDLFGAPVGASIEVRTWPGDIYVTVVAASGVDGGYSVNLVYGEYRLIASHAGNSTESQTVLLDAPSVDLDFVLGVYEERVLVDDGFESGLGGWTGNWGVAEPADGHDSANCLADSPGADVKYDDNSDSACEMVAGVDLGLALDGELTFWAKWDIESGWDCVKLQVSIDGGTAWTAVATDRTEAGSGQGAQVPASDPVFDGSQANWTRNTVDLAPWFGEADVRFRFWLGSDGSLTKDGFYVDDFVLTITVDATAGVDDLPAPQRQPLVASPNPFNPRTTLSCVLDRSGPVSLAVYDLQGRLVRELFRGHAEAGAFTARWDGLTGGGSRAASGVYFARLTAADSRQTLKMMLIK